ncbi:protein of unknown function [Cyanobium sp. NIES-981]|nr:protein of unknown function [Cyanobium sp. NIES-981]
MPSPPPLPRRQTGPANRRMPGEGTDPAAPGPHAQPVGDPL